MKLRILLLWLALAATTSRGAHTTCGGTYRGFQYTISSPNYPHEYPEHQECTYHLQGDASAECEQEFHLQFQDFDVRASDHCRDDYLQVGDRSVFCGTVVGLRKFTSDSGNNNNNSLTVRFHSGSSREPKAKGFKVLVMALPCSLKLDRAKNHANDVDAKSPKITPYLFLPPNERKNSSSATELLPPSFEASAFRPSAQSSWDKSSTRGHGGEPSFDCGNSAAAAADSEFSQSANRHSYYRQHQDFQGHDASRLGSGLIYDPHRGLLGANGFYYNQQPGYSGYPITDYQSPLIYPSAPGNPGYYPPSASQVGAYQSAFNPYSAWNNNNNGVLGECCRLQQTGRRFLLASPGFPGSASSSSTGTYTCRYTIAKSSPDVCRLRLSFRFFNFGAESGPYCSHGHVEIDGRRYCGCRSGQTLQVPFAESYAKPIYVAHAGYPRTKFSGFLVDVIQEPCGGGGGGGGGISPGYYPPCPPSALPGYPSYPPCGTQQPYDPNSPIYSPYLLLRRQGLPQVAAANSSAAVRFRSKREDLGYYSYPKPSIRFEDGSEAEVILPIGAGDQQQPRDRFFGGSCQSRVLLDWAVASKESVLRNGRCERFGTYRSASDRSDAGGGGGGGGCEEVDDLRGAVESPTRTSGSYPGGVRKCWRFKGAENFCKLELRFADFELESSQGCEKEYLSFNNEDRRYCGSSLSNRNSIFDLRPMGAVEMHFVSSDSREAGSGFNIVFSQQPCRVSTK